MKKLMAGLSDNVSDIKSDPYTLLLFYILNSQSKTLPFDLEKLDVLHLLRRASPNRVLYVFCEKAMNFDAVRQLPYALSLCKSVIEEGDKKIIKIRKTLEHIICMFNENKIPYLVVKTVKHYPYILNDIDLLVARDDYSKATGLLKDFWGQKSGHKKLDDGCDQFDSEQWYKIDLHYQFSWLNSQKLFIDNDIVWKNKRIKKLFGVDCFVPSESIEWMLNALNIMYERFYFSINDFVTLSMDLSFVDMALVFEQANKHQWNKSLDIFNTQFNGIKSFMDNDNKYKIIFPYLYNYTDIIQSYWEQLRKRGVFDFHETLYNLSYARMKSLFSSNEQVSMYGDWFDFSRYKSN